MGPLPGASPWTRPKAFSLWTLERAAAIQCFISIAPFLAVVVVVELGVEAEDGEGTEAFVAALPKNALIPPPVDEGFLIPSEVEVAGVEAGFPKKE